MILVENEMMLVDVTVLGLAGGAPGGETPRVADSSARLVCLTAASSVLCSFFGKRTSVLLANSVLCTELKRVTFEQRCERARSALLCWES